MECSSCKIQLPVGVAYCPNCGAVTPYNISEVGIAASDPTAASSSSGAPLHVPPSTDYGSPPYGVSQPSIYESFDPYHISLPPPPPPKRPVKTSLIIVAVVLVLILASMGVFALLVKGVKNNPPAIASTPTPATAQTNITATATPSAFIATSTTSTENIPYSPFRGTLVLNDPLRDNSKGYNWQEISDSNGSCAFTGGAYHAKTLAGGYYNPCPAQNTDFANFAFEVQMKIMKGDCGAILFRVNRSVTNFYYFRVCQDGTYALYVYSNNNGSTLIDAHSHSAINAGLNRSNLLAVAVRGSTLDLYVNQQQVDSISDTTYSRDQIAVVADGTPGNHPTEVIYSNARVWTL
jgi:hypothetical protein